MHSRPHFWFTSNTYKNYCYCSSSYYYLFDFVRTFPLFCFAAADQRVKVFLYEAELKLKLKKKTNEWKNYSIKSIVAKMFVQILINAKRWIVVSFVWFRWNNGCKICFWEGTSCFVWANCETLILKMIFRMKISSRCPALTSNYNLIILFIKLVFKFIFQFSTNFWHNNLEIYIEYP